MVELSELTRAHVRALFGAADVEEACRMLREECGDALPLLSGQTPQGLERVRFAAIRVSEGRLDELRRAIELARIDWRDLLVAADFADDVRAHLRWRSGVHKER